MRSCLALVPFVAVVLDLQRWVDREALGVPDAQQVGDHRLVDDVAEADGIVYSTNTT